ncbi:MAG: phosphoribosylglycinamide formyltransferase [Clostridia bacterium]|nr:phosphoribosylglycinamide formyltransferase [Clostridia bacterium]
MKRLAVFVSGGGTDLQSVLDAQQEGRLNGSVELVVSSKAGVYALERAKKAGVSTAVFLKKEYPSAEEMNEAIIALLQEYRIDGIVLAGYLNILTPNIVRAYRNKIINIHPSLIPSFCGAGYYGLRVHSAVLSYGAKISGATVHFVDEGADTGPIIMQRAVPVSEGDTPESLQERVLEVEHQLLPEAVALFCADRLQVEGRIVKIKE